MLNKSKKKLKKDIARELRSIFDLIVKMSVLNENFHSLASSEYEIRKAFKLKCDKLMGEGETVIFF